ncbi:Flap endonuclease GEN-like protein 1 [Psilocybe cubensis]|uniref:PIN domain-like protein n=6 Tax=Psilocybe cubensis TaxID=181762 RepID=A0A8H7YAT8_PSICU|nr:Flap endonuclease GEN-like protein 1 [Psilocybe cubensis]XP_047749826.1 Flap endonuclease GEN-like protein 1 [Psilocybe cubensis]XP_047749829.1 Flap endonuclease GEN-like protein 1 [Psilocybe cubensis]XP_047754687.1 Flap endonuclease GEN-like protein 1 [Psilocybe cubensis]XP_047754690.1 Flap endonuclease GEN-like protein 1 [Psilocybe cubensis]KAH9481588.1 Flap endonuclease GEN-like protein 1 [Psilocybe cubensis]KAH9482201.1 Flap endonuclease GEN-like protein 1 [Psilocybe cubensis]KAH94822
MGVKGLWKLLDPVATRASFQRLAVEDGFMSNRQGTRGYRLGVDAMGWIYRACYRHGATKNMELATLNARCSRLYSLPILPIFVFDGPNKPSIKRKKNIRGNRHWIEADFKSLLDAYGFIWCEAPGEAEAELARLTKEDYLDAVLTEDSDSIVFGTTTVLRIDEDVSDDEQVVVYRSSDILQALQMNSEDMVLIALLVGGDYNPGGVKGCGIETALGLAKAGFGRSLACGLKENNYSQEAQQQFLHEWRSQLISEAHSNSSFHLPRRCPSLAHNLPADFPSSDILSYYLHPVVSDDLIPVLFSRQLSLPAMMLFAEDHFVWGTDAVVMLRHLSNSILPGIALRSAMQIARARDIGFHYYGHMFFGQIVGKRQSSKRSPELRVKIDFPKDIIQDGINRLRAAQENPRFDQSSVDSWIQNCLPKLRAWIPSNMMEGI